MRAPRRHLDGNDLAPLVRAAFDGARDLVRVERLTGGSRKGVYRLTLDDAPHPDDASSVVAYVWNDDENYWPTADPERGDGPSPDEGFDRFVAAHRILEDAGAQVPNVYHLDRSRNLIAGDVAILQDQYRGTLEDLIAREPRSGAEAVQRLGVTVRAMHTLERAYPGLPGEAPPASPEREPGSQIASAERERAHLDLAEAAARVPRIAAVERQLAEVLDERFAAIEPRARFGLIHGELGPDHVMLGRGDRPVLIDIEGVRFSDIESEHAFLEFRFGELYFPLKVDGLDVDRLRLYRLATYLSCVAGPLRLLDGDFPRRAAMLDIVEQNIGRTLAQL